MNKPAAPCLLPPSVVGRAELGRLIRELERIETELEVQKMRNNDVHQAPAMSQQLNGLLEANQLDITDARIRLELKERLRILKDKAPNVHLTFAAEPEQQALEQLIGWVREQLHPQALMTVGLQPSIIGGVYMRTPNRVYDFSWRALLADKREIIVRELEEITRGAG